MHERGRRPSLGSPERPGILYVVLVGFYAALLFAPAVVIGFDLWVTNDGGVLYLSLLGSVSLITVIVAAVTTRWCGLPERLGATKLRWGLPVLPVFAGLSYVTLSVLYSPLPVLGTPFVALPAGLLGMVTGAGLAATARTRYVDAVVGDPPVDCEWRASRQRPWRDRAPELQYAVVLVLLVVFVAGVVWRIERWYVAGPVLVVHLLLLQTPTPTQQRSYQVTPLGLEQTEIPGRAFHFWDAFECYEVTDDALVLHWRAWWRPASRYDLSDIEDPEAVEKALAEYLPRA